MAKRGRPRYPDILTLREWEVLALLREELTNEQIAQRLGITERTAKYHVAEILGKLGVGSRQEAAAWDPESRPWWLAAVMPLLFWRKLSFGWLSAVTTAVAAVSVAGLLALLVWALVRTDGDSPDQSAAVEQAVREYFLAISKADAELFCGRIQPHLGFFTDEENCREVQGYQAAGNRIAPHYREQLLRSIEAEVLGFQSMQVDGGEARTEVTVAWTGEGDAGPERLGQAVLTVRLQRPDRWRVASFPNRTREPSGDPNVAALTEAVFDYYEALRVRGSGGPMGYPPHWPGPTGVNEHRSEILLTAVFGVEVEGDFAIARVETHIPGNGAVSHPSPSAGRVFLARMRGEWRRIDDQQHEAWKLFEQD